MVIEKSTKFWETCSSFPNTNYTDIPDEDAWVVPDDTELADKIKSLVRRWNPVLDEHGNLIDVEWDGTEEPKPPEPEPTTEDILNALLGVTV